ncbi:MAG: DNA polymerase III subunit alpha [Bacteroidales bacterium]|nr:DNA polymerase III subunit alpha [Bacteroidales bacterium]
MQDFVHLHVHTQYSVLDGQAAIGKLVDKAIANGMRGLAITDHGNMFGIKEYFNLVSKLNGKREKEGLAPFKPIFGCEVYVAPRRMTDRDKDLDRKAYHLILLAKNKKGYHNLIKIVSNAWTIGQYGHPRTDREQLRKYREGIICCSACLGGEVPQKILANRLEEAEEAIAWYKQLYGSDYYIELQRHKATVPRANHEIFVLQQAVNAKLVEYARRFDVKIICTNDVHFVNEDNAEAHDRLICLSTGKDLDDPKRMLYSKQEWMKTREEMNEVFADLPEALSNTCDICDQVEIYSIDHPPIMPNYEIPRSFGTEEEYRQRFSEKDLFDEFTQDENGNVVMSEEEAQKKIKKLGGYEKLYRIKLEADYLAKLAYDGAQRIYGDKLTQEHRDLMKFELHIMKTMGFPGYFLIVQDFIRAARKELGVWVGPGRGSAAGSLVAYCLEITKIDPVKYDLLFERFLNPDRISLPDIDVDFDDDGRGLVLEWVTKKYGQEKVAHIITYSTMATKMAIKDVARVQGLPLSESDRLCKSIPDKLADGKKMNLANAIAQVKELQEAEASPDPTTSDTIKYAKMLEGNVRGTGVHACGTIICRDDITDWVPVSTAIDKDTNERLLVTEYEGSVIEDTGLIKMDFLGLKTLSIMKDTVENIKRSQGIVLDVDNIPLDDAPTYNLYCEGRTIGTFQFESPGMQKYLRELQPSVFEDLIAMNALYRPGPMDYIPDFIDRKHGRKPIEYDIPIMEKYLKDTYGITVYQEQVMLLSRLLANFTRGESDTLRKAMGKKLKDKLDHLRPKFMEGGQANGHKLQTLEKIWADWEKFASYAFNKSHATCYSWVAFQTAYLKANFPAEYMAACMSRNSNNINEISKLMDECKANGIHTLGPSINESYDKFSVNHKGKIRFGLSAIKGVGTSAVNNIIAERERNGLFKDIFDFVQRIDLSTVNRKCVESLAIAGAFDEFSEIHREDFLAVNNKNEVFSDILIRYGNKYQLDKRNCTNSLFGDMTVEISTPPIPSAPAWTDLERLNRERELVGIYLTGHPLDQFSIILKHVCNTQIVQLNDLTPLQGQNLTMGGIVTASSEGQSKNGNPYGRAKIEDYSGTFDFVFFGKDWDNVRTHLVPGRFVFLRATVQPKKWKQEEWELKVNQVELLADVKDSLIQSLTITIPLLSLSKPIAVELSALLSGSPGNVAVQFVIIDNEQQANINMTAPQLKTSITKELIDFFDNNPELSYRNN